MKKKLLIVVICIIIVVWIMPYVAVEIKTLLHGGEFKKTYKQIDMFGTPEYIKVFEYSDKKAKLFICSENHDTGDFLYCKKKKGKWVVYYWDTVWSKHGSASGFTFPLYF